jgi:hypothetical protein
MIILKTTAMNELTKEQKLCLIKDSIGIYKNHPDYLCRLITDRAFSNFGYINDLEYGYGNDTTITVTLIPEFLKFKPEDKKNEDPWFGNILMGTERRLEVLSELYELINKL